MSVLAMPPSPGGSVQQQLGAQYGYLFQLVQQLNSVLGALEAQRGRSTGASTVSQSAKGAQQYDTLRTMIVRTADAANEATERLAARLISSDAALSPCLQVESSADGTLRGEAQALCQRLEAAIDVCRPQVESRGVVRYEGQTPVYGAAIGDGLSVCDGAVEPSGTRAVFTPEEMGIWQDGAEVVRVANRCLHAEEADISAAAVGDWRVETTDGLCIRWMGGTEDGSIGQ